MDLLQANINQNGIIESNFKQVEDQLVEKLSVYSGVIVTEDTVAASKKDVAEIRKTRTSIDDVRKSVKKQWMIPYEEFEEKCNHLLELCDGPINEINSQIKEFEEKKKAAKKQVVEELYEKTIGEYSEYLPFEQIFDAKWLNVSTKEKDIEFDLSEKKTKVMSELNIIKGLNSEIESELLNIYKNKGNDLAAAITRNTQYIQDKAKIESQIKPVEVKPNAEAMGTLNEMVNKTKTVKFIISAEDSQRVQNMLDFEEISYRIVEE